MSRGSQPNTAAERLRQEAKLRWQPLLRAALEADVWGQTLEAVSEYTKYV